MNKDALFLFGSMKTGVKGDQKDAVWRTMTAAGRALPWTSGRAAALTQSRVRAYCCNEAPALRRLRQFC